MSAAFPFVFVVTEVVVLEAGTEVVVGLRAIRPEIPVVIITGHGEDVMAAEAQAGVVEFLQKPFGPDQLRAVLRRHLPGVKRTPTEMAK